MTAAAGRVGVQHLQEEVVHQHHVLPLHGGQVVHAFVTVGNEMQDYRHEAWDLENVLRSLLHFSTIALH